jgi:putative inorganic carbon (HCO3(-)) transporter
MILSLAGALLAIIMLGAFFLGLRTGVVALIFIRPLCDPFFAEGKFEIAGQTLSFGALINVAVIVVLFLNFSQIWRSVPAKVRTIWLPFLVLAFAAVIYSPVPSEALRTYLNYFSFFVMFSIAFAVVRSEHDFLYFLKLIILSSVLPAIYGLLQLAAGFNLYEERIQSTFAHPNIFAFFIDLVIGAILFLQSTSRLKVSGQYRLFLLVYLLPLIVLLIFTKTRSAWVGCAIEFLVYGIVYDRRVLALLLLSPFVVLAIPEVSDRISDLSSGNDYIGGSGSNLNAYAWRMLLWENAFTYIWQRPFFGYGLNTFRLYTPQFFVLDSVNGGDAHSVYIQTIFEMGFVGIIGLGLIFCRSFIWLARFWRCDKRGVPVVAASMIAYLDFCYSDNILYYLAFDWSFWFFFGLIFAQFSQYWARVSGHRIAHHWQMRAREKGVLVTGSHSPGYRGLE